MDLFCNEFILKTMSRDNRLMNIPDLIKQLPRFCHMDCYGKSVSSQMNTSRSFPHSRLITGFTTRSTRRVSQMEQELPTLPKHLISPLVFSGVRVTRSLVLCVCFVDRCLSFCTFSFWPLCCLFFSNIRIMITSLVYSNSF